jgi:hypothetical protein
MRCFGSGRITRRARSRGMAKNRELCSVTSCINVFAQLLIIIMDTKRIYGRESDGRQDIIIGKYQEYLEKILCWTTKESRRLRAGYLSARQGIFIDRPSPLPE